MSRTGGTSGCLRQLGLLLLLTPALLGVVAVPSAAANERTGPPLGVPTSELDPALTCAGDVAGARVDPVILVHGMPSTATSWRSSYVFALAEEGIPVCTVALPDHGLSDLQVATEYVVHAIVRVARQSHRQVSVVGHSGGGLELLWALRFWPEARLHVTDLVGLAVPFSGGRAPFCNPDCAPAFWQAGVGSRFLAAATPLPLPEGPAYTSIASTMDESVSPADARLEGATNIVVQDICPGRPTDHAAMLFDNVVYRLFRDARAHDGPADPSRLPPGICTTSAMPVNPITAPEDAATVAATIIVASATSPRVSAEPALFCYADPTSARGVGTYCPPFGRGAGEH